VRTIGEIRRNLAAVSAGLAVVACSAPAHLTSALEAAPQPSHAGRSEHIRGLRVAPGGPAGSDAAHPAARARSTRARREASGAAGNRAGHVFVPKAARAFSTTRPDHVIGTGRPSGCTSAAVVRAVARGGVITFDCGPKPVTITMKATAKVVNTSHQVVLDGGGRITLSGGGKHRILYMNTCDKKQIWTTADCWQQRWPRLIVQNITLKDAYSNVRETKTSSYGGGAIFDEGGQLKVADTTFINDRCYKSGPDLGGGAIRALGMWPGSPVYITKDTFRGGRCSSGAGLSSIDASWDVLNSLFSGNRTTGPGGSAGGGNGGAIYTDGDNYDVTIDGTIIRSNDAPHGEGGAVFFVIDSGTGTLKIEYSTLHHNPAGGYQNLPGIYDGVDGKPTAPVVIHSTIN
jgi:hypothetical protein